VKKRIRLNTVAALASVIGVAAGSAAHAQTGIASIYTGGKTASGELARAGGMTAAHKTLPFGTMVRVTNKRSGRSIIVRINDRGPFVRGRIIDLMPAAARAIGCSGIAHVTVEVVGRRTASSVSEAPQAAGLRSTDRLGPKDTLDAKDSLGPRDTLGPSGIRGEGLPS
jgi:rare lipoprotein A